MFVIFAIIGLSILIFFHEFGHFITAKIFKIKVEEFGLGYPPRLGGFIFKKSLMKLKFFFGRNQPRDLENQTIYSLNWIPFGGFNRLKGEMGDEDNSPDSFFAQIWWKKAIVALGGAGMNIILAFLIFVLCYTVGLPQEIDDLRNGKILEPIGIQIGMIYPNSPAEINGLKIGDIIIALNGEEAKSVEQVQAKIKENWNAKLMFKIKRQEKIMEKEIEVISAQDIFSDWPVSEQGAIGIALSEVALISYPFPQAIKLGFKTTVSLMSQITSGLGLIFKNLFFHGKMVGKFLGPVGITNMAAQMAQVGIIYLLQFVGLLSVAIGIFQIIPFPALDGSRVLLSLIEGIRGKSLKRKTENILFSLGFYLLLLLLIFITLKEVFNLF